MRRRTRHVFSALATAGALAAAATASADNVCNLSLTAGNVNLVWDLAFATQQISFTVNKTKKKACDYVVTFSKGNSTDYNRRMVAGASQLRYQLYKESSLTNSLKAYPDVTSSNDVIEGSFSSADDQSSAVTYFLQIPFSLATQPALKPAGTYTDTVVLSIYRGTATSPASGTPEATVSVNLATALGRLIQLSLVPSGSGFDPNATTQVLNFGTLTEGASRGFDMRVLSNAGYSITFSSQNNGALKATTAGVSSTVPYTLMVAGVPKSLASSATSPVVVATGGGQTGTEGALNAVGITIGSTQNAVAGPYSDFITVTAATTE